MNPYIVPVTCSICGGPGNAHVKDMAEQWFGGEFHHKNPAECKEYMHYKKRMQEELNNQKTIQNNDNGSGI